MNHKAIIKALATLESEGRKYYQDDYKPTQGECLGAALAAVNDSGKLPVQIAIAALEFHNRHGAVEHLAKLLPKQ